MIIEWVVLVGFRNATWTVDVRDAHGIFKVGRTIMIFGGGRLAASQPPTGEPSSARLEVVDVPNRRKNVIAVKGQKLVQFSGFQFGRLGCGQSV